MAFETILVEKREGIGYLTFNRPDAFNAFNTKMVLEVVQALAELDKDDEVRVVIITGAGKAFQAGADIKELAYLNPLEGLEYNRRTLAACSAPEKMKKPTIAAMNGVALGGGLEIALGCNIRVASEKARMGLPEVTLGILPGSGGTQRLPRLIGKSKALEMILTGEAVNAEEAYRIGLVNKVVPPGEELKAAEEIAQKIIKCAPLAVEMAKDAVEVGKDLSQDAACEYAQKNIVALFASEDGKEGLTSFVEKRTPQFKGK